MNAQVAELVDAPVLEAGIERCASSSLALGTKFCGKESKRRMDKLLASQQPDTSPATF